MSLIKVKSRGTDNVTGRRNLIINGAMQIAQRGTSFTSVSATAYHLDRFQYYVTGMDELRTTVQQDGIVPAGADSGFSKSLKIDCTTAESAFAADENARVWQKIEAQDLVRLGYGTSGAKTTTLSFYVKSSLTGTYAVSFWCQDPNRNIAKTYTINAANTWEKKTITIPGDTGGTGINNDNGEGMRINWFLNAGSNFTSVNTNNQWDGFVSGRHAFGHTAAWGTNTSHDFFLTGVQFEVGGAATDFEHRSFGEELSLCQRYYHQANFTAGPHYGGGALALYAFNATEAGGTTTFPVTMRAAPTVRIKDAAGNIGGIHRAAVGNVTSGVAVGWAGNADANAKGISQVYKTNAWATGNMLIGGYEAVAEL